MPGQGGTYALKTADWLRAADASELAGYIYRLLNAYKFHAVHSVGRSSIGRAARDFHKDEDLDLTAAAVAARRLMAREIRGALDEAIVEVRRRVVTGHGPDSGDEAWAAILKDTEGRLASEVASWKQYLKDRETLDKAKGTLAPPARAAEVKADAEIKPPWEARHGWTPDLQADAEKRATSERERRATERLKRTIGSAAARSSPRADAADLRKAREAERRTRPNTPLAHQGVGNGQRLDARGRAKRRHGSKRGF